MISPSLELLIPSLVLLSSVATDGDVDARLARRRPVPPGGTGTCPGACRLVRRGRPSCDPRPQCQASSDESATRAGRGSRFRCVLFL